MTSQDEDITPTISDDQTQALGQLNHNDIQHSVENPLEAEKLSEVINDQIPEHNVSLDQPTEFDPVKAAVENLTKENVDLESISLFLDTDSESLKSIDRIILTKIQAKVNQITNLEAEKTVLEVNLEQSTILNNKRFEVLKNQAKKAKDQNTELLQKISTLESLKSESDAKISQLASEIQTSASQSQLNGTKLEEVYANNRKTIELLGNKNEEIETLKSDYNSILESNSKLRKELIELESTNQKSNSSVVQSKLKVQSLESQIDLITKNNDWLNTQLKSLTEEYSDYRKGKSSELSALQAKYEANSNEFASLKAKDESLSSRYEEVTLKLDNALLQVKKLSDEKALSEEEFIRETSVKDRLIELLKKSNEDFKSQVQYLDDRLKSSKTDVANESAVLQTTLEDYKTKLSQSDTRIRQLEETIDELSKSSNVGDDSLGSVLLSPSAKLTASKANGLSLSQLYADFSITKKQLIKERRSKERMQQQIDAFVNELEQKAPLINATKERARLLEDELSHLSIILETTTNEKEGLERLKVDLSNKLKEHELTITSLNRQKVDLARQVQNLLVQVTIRGDSSGPLTPAEQQALARIAKGDSVFNESDTDKLISDRLVVFQNIGDLQKKNEELLRIIRELGSKLEKEEQRSKSKLEELENTAIKEAKEAILTLQDEIQTIETKLQSVTRERDMFRSLTAGKGSISGNILNDGVHGGNEGELKKLQDKFEQAQADITTLHQQLQHVQVESQTTIDILNKQITSLTNERSEFSVNLARERSSATLYEERYKSLQENLKFSKSEIDELRQRSQSLQESLAKQDLRTQQVAEELIEKKSILETLQSENSNLRAEKNIWNTIEKRLTDENTSLIEEKSRLNTMLLNLQALEKERETNSSGSQRRAQLQYESLEKDLVYLREKLSQAELELKENISRKDADTRAFQERIASLSAELSSTREQLILKTGQAENLESKIEHITSKLTSTESLLKGYQELTTTDGTNGSSSLPNEALKLKSQLEDAKVELEESNISIEKFKSIASSAEESLNSINETFDSYKSATNEKIEELETENKTLNEKITILNEQLESSNNELNETKTDLNKQDELHKVELDKLKSELVANQQLKKDYDAKIALIEESYKQQESIASESQQNYHKELQKHAEVSKAVSLLRDESNQLKQTLQTLSIEAKQSKEELAKSQEFWDTVKSKLEDELKNANTRVQDLVSQNHILYNQIESLSKSKEFNSNNDVEGEIPTSADDELRQLINLLRREKELSNTELEVSNRDLKRVRQQLNVANDELDRTRLELAKLINSSKELEHINSGHEELLKEIQQLNILRESNTTLRNELQQNVAKVKELEIKLTESNGKLEPLEVEVVSLKAEITHKDQELKLNIEEKNRWKQRSQDILNKFDRIDPEEHEVLKKKIDEISQQKEELEKNSKLEETKFSELKVKYDDLQGSFNKLKSEAQDKLKRRGAENRELSAQLNTTKEELKKLQTSSEEEIKKLKDDLDQLQTKSVEVSKNDEEAEALKKEVEELKANLSSKEQELAKLKEFEQKFNEQTGVVETLEERIATLTREIEELKSKSTTADNLEVTQLKESLEAEKESLTKEREEFEQAKIANKDPSAVSNEEEISTKLKELETKLRAQFEVEKAEELEQWKAKVRAPSQEKLKQLSEARAQKLKAEYEVKFKELEEKSKLNSNGVAQKEHESKIAELTEKVEQTKKLSYEEGRQSTLKEGAMRSKLLQNKVEKLTKEKKELEAKLNAKSQLPNKPSPAIESGGVKRPAENQDGSQEKKVKNDESQ